MKRLFASFSIVALLAATLVAPLQAAVPTATIGYLQGQSKSNEWVLMALKAGGQSVSANQISVPVTNEATSLERIILGVIAGGENPTNFLGRNLIAELDAKRVNKQIGVENQLNDDMWGIIAYYAAGFSSSDTRIQESKQHLLNNQNTDGGWGFANTVESDSNDTAMAIIALIRAGMSASDQAIDRALAYLGSTQTNSGGFAISEGFDADSASTAWVISALQAAGKNPSDFTNSGKSPFDFFSLTQGENGGYKWKPGDANDSPVMTAYVAIAYAGTSYPVNRYTAPATPPPAQPVQQPAQETEPVETQNPVAEEQSVSGVIYRLEGSQGQLCSGNTEATNALEVLEKAAIHCNLSYIIEETSFGPYVQTVETDSASGEKGWLYLVNWEQPSVGANDYALEEGDYVTWYYGKFDIRPLRLQVLSTTESEENILVDVFVEYYDGEAWLKAEGVSVMAGSTVHKTDGGGKASFSLALGEAYTVYAGGEGYVRSAVEVIRSENQMSFTLPLEANITSEQSSTNSNSGSSRFREALQNQIPEPELAFTVTPVSGQELLAFGDLRAGMNASQQVILKNTGDVVLEFTATVEGHALFIDHLEINETTWSQFALDLQPESEGQADVQLSVPTDYTQTGLKTGELIFWATP